MGSSTAAASSSLLNMNPTGITVVFEPEQPNIDVVFVHGFTGHPYRTWACKGKQTDITAESDGPPNSKRRRLFEKKDEKESSFEIYWPRDLLPKTIPLARVLTFGYDTRIRHAWASEGSKNSIYDHAKELLQSLNDYRIHQESAERPILFIAHSLGGIVVKEALRQSQRLGKSHRQQDLYLVSKSTIGVMFFGTPHRGADPRGFLHHIAQNVIEAVGYAAPKHVVGSLMPDSERLKELLEDFNPLAHENNWLVCSFQEQHGVKALGGKKVVEDVSSCLGDPGVEIIRGIESNHMDMCRFKRLNDNQYLRVASAVRYILDGYEKGRRSLHPTGETILHKAVDSTSTISLEESRVENTGLAGRDPGTKGIHSYVEDTVSDNDIPDPEANETESVSVAASHSTPSIPVSHLSQEQRQILAASLEFDQIDARLDDLRPHKPQTCAWILTTPQYKQWKDPALLSRHHGFMWIKGKPGAGKSIKMKYLFSKAKTTIRGGSVISFFFNARGAELEHSTLGLYRSLLFQLLKKDSSLQAAFDILGHHASKHLGRDGWQLQTLQSVLAQAIDMMGGQALVIYIDALDECPEDEIRDMISFLEEVGERAVESGVRLNICFSSRHYPHITIKRGLILVLEGEKSHAADIETYIDSELRINQPEHFADIKDRIVAKSSGVFLWVALVIPILNKAFDSGKMKALKKKLDELPPGLSDLFRDLLLRDTNDRAALVSCIQWVMFAKVPMKLEELYFAIEKEDDSDVTFYWDQDEITTDAMKLALLGISKGLVEQTRSETPTMQFIHESVRDFLLKEHGLQQVWPDLSDDFEGRSHCSLAKRCLQQIQADLKRLVLIPSPLPKTTLGSAPLRRHATRILPFLEYATMHVLSHSNAAQGLGLPQSEFMERFPLALWLVYFNLIVNPMSRRHLDDDISLLYILAEQDLVHLVRIHPDRDRLFQIKGGRYQTPLFAALACGSREVSRDLGLQVFLDGGFLIPDWEQYDDFFASLKPNRQFDCRKRTLLTGLAHLGCLSAIKALLLQGYNIDEKDESGQTPLSSASTLETVIFLLENGADPDVEDAAGGVLRIKAGVETHYAQLLQHGFDPSRGNGYDMIKCAVRKDNSAVVEQTMSRFGVEFMNLLDRDGQSFFSHAIDQQSIGVARLMCSTEGVQVDWPGDNAIETALEFALTGDSDWCELVKLLIGSNKMHPDHRFANGQTPLSRAAEMDSYEIVKLLLNSGKVNPDSVDNEGRTPLLWAAERGNHRVVELLLNSRKVNPDSVDNEGRTLLSWAVERGNHRVVELLLNSRKVSPDSVDNEGRTPLSWAAEMGSHRVVELLLNSRKVNPDSVDNEGRTPLSWAAELGSREMVKLLLDSRKVNPDSVDNKGRTPLSWAAEMGSHQVVELLLNSRKVNPDSIDNEGRTPLSWAAEWLSFCLIRERSTQTLSIIKAEHLSHMSQDTGA